MRAEGRERMSRHPTGVEPFAGCGGMALGLRDAGFACVHASDADPHAVETLRQVVPDAEVLRLDATNAGALAARILDAHGQPDLLAAGVPCQPFSTAGRNAGEYDPRDGFPAFLALAQWLRPRAILIENVKGLTSKRHRPHLDHIVADLEATGYGVRWRVLNAADFSVPQRRERIFIVGFLDHAVAARFAWPEPSHSEAALVWAKWGELGVKRGGILGGSYWAEQDLEGPSTLWISNQVNEKHQREGRRPWSSIDDPSATIRGHSTSPGIVRNTGLHRAPELVDPDEPSKTIRDEARDQFRPLVVPDATRPTRRELSVLKRIKQGKLEVTGQRWRTVRDALGDLLATEQIACRRGREGGSKYEMRSLDDVAVALRGSVGGSSQPFVIGAGSNPHGPDREHERNRRDITDEPAPVMASERIGNRGPWVANHDPADQRPAAPGDVLRFQNQGARPHQWDEAAASVRGLRGRGPELIPAKQDIGDTNLIRTPTLRRLSIRECARLQDFPDWLVFAGSKTAQYRQVGNSCPPALAEAVGRAIRVALER